MKTHMRKIIESRYFFPVIALLYLALAGVLLAIPGTRSRDAIQILLTQLVPKTLWVNFLLIALGVCLCRRDIAAAFGTLGNDDAQPAATGCDAPPDADILFNDAQNGQAPDLTARWRDRLNRPGLYLLLVLIAGLFLVSLVAPQIHRIYYDEDIYANMAQNIAVTGQTGMANYATFEYGQYFPNWLLYNKDPSGWPFVLSLVFQLFGVDETYMFYLNNLLFAGGIVVVFFITRLIAGGFFPGLLAALIYALIPHNLIWSNTGAAETAAAFFGGLAVLCTLVYLRSRAARHLFLLATVLPFVCSMRPESALIVLWVLAALAVGTPRTADSGTPLVGGQARRAMPHPFATREFWAMGVIAFALVIPQLWHLYAMSGESWGATGAKFSTFFFLGNLSVNGRYYLNNSEFPVLFTLLALTGFLFWRRRAAQERGKDDFFANTLLLFWFLLFWGIFLFFYAGSYKYGADVRFALLSFMPLAVLAGMGGEVILKKQKSAAIFLVLILIFSWLKFLPQVRLVGQEAWAARFDHHYAEKFVKVIPNRSIVVTHIPTMFLLRGENAIQSYAAVNNPDIIQDLMKRYNGQVFFHQNYWCNTPNDGNRAVCDAIRLKYDLEPVATAREQNYEYGLYRMTFKK